MTITVLCALMLGAATTTPTSENAFDAIVAATELDGWHQVGKPALYNKDNLFDLIDGEAEMYFPYGFKRVAAIEYRQGEDEDTGMTAEIYEMGSLLDAFGVYSNYRDVDSAVIEIGAEGYSSATQIVFYQDAYFVKVSARKSAAKPENVLACAKALSKALPDKKEKPKELALVKLPDLMPQSEQYIAQSLLGYAPFPKGMIAKVKLGEKIVRVFVVLVDKPNTPDTVFKQYTEQLAKDNITPHQPDPKTLTVVDPMLKGTLLAIVGEVVVGVTDLDTPDQGLPILKVLSGNIH